MITLEEQKRRNEKRKSDPVRVSDENLGVVYRGQRPSSTEATIQLPVAEYQQLHKKIDTLTTKVEDISRELGASRKSQISSWHPLDPPPKINPQYAPKNLELKAIAEHIVKGTNKMKGQRKPKQ